MPKAARRQSGPQSVRSEPYPPNVPASLKENYCPHHAAERVGQDPTPYEKQPVFTKSSNVKSRAPPHDEEQGESGAGSVLQSQKSDAKERPKSTTAVDNAKPSSFLDIKLDGEDTDSVIIYDNCATLRRKLKNFLGKDNNSPKNGMPGQTLKDGKPKPYTQTQLCKDLGVSAVSLRTFLGKKRGMGGGTSPVYPAAYAFFEKKRIFENAKKTKTREEVEADHPEGYPRDFDPNTTRITIARGENVRDVMASFGRDWLL